MFNSQASGPVHNRERNGLFPALHWKPILIAAEQSLNPRLILYAYDLITGYFFPFRPQFHPVLAGLIIQPTSIIIVQIQWDSREPSTECVLYKPTVITPPLCVAILGSNSLHARKFHQWSEWVYGGEAAPWSCLTFKIREIDTLPILVYQRVTMTLLAFLSESLDICPKVLSFLGRFVLKTDPQLLPLTCTRFWETAFKHWPLPRRSRGDWSLRSTDKERVSLAATYPACWNADLCRFCGQGPQTRVPWFTLCSSSPHPLMAATP